MTRASDAPDLDTVPPSVTDRAAPSPLVRALGIFILIASVPTLMAAQALSNVVYR